MMTTTPDTTVGAIVAEDFRTAAVFHRHGIDFCCRGGRPLDEACRESGADLAAVRAELTATTQSVQGLSPRFAAWDSATLINYIVANHHAYVREVLPTLVAHAEKVASVHGERHPELAEIAQLVEAVSVEMSTHMLKEEHILFSYIRAAADASKQGCPPPLSPFGTIENPIRMMEAEHESAGGAMARIRELTGGYQAPADACTTYRVFMKELEAFEQDLHAHVHLENNILFPKARLLESTS
jgi:regulator of cell morphogenesis and NO signaling